MTILEHPDVSEIDAIDATLRRWEGLFGVAAGFSSGDFGWELRNGPAHMVSQLRVVREGEAYVAIAWPEGENGLFIHIDPARLMDIVLAERIAGDIDDEGIREVTCQAVPASIRRSLGARGYAIDTSPWVHLWQPLTDAHVIEVTNVVPTSTEAIIEQRVAVQRSAFGGSTFTVDKWRSMASGPAFVPTLDLVAQTGDGEGAAALTAWLPGPDACGMLEPVGTHADHRRQGHASRAMRAAFAELRHLGASGVRVYTPRENASAVEAYKANGFLIIDYDTTMIRPAP